MGDVEALAGRLTAQEAMIARMQGVIERQVEEARRSATALEDMRRQVAQGAQMQAALANLPAAMAEAVKSSGPRLLVDNRGLGKPAMFSNKEEDFLVWTRKTSNYVASIFPNAKEIMRLAADSAAGPGAPVDV